MINQEQALSVLNQHIKNKSLINHCLAVEAGMRIYAEKYEEDENIWGITGLLHDVDYEKFPDDHPSKEGVRIFKEAGLFDESIYAFRAHGHDVEKYPRKSKLDKTLFAVDEMAGFIIAVSLVRPNKLEGLKVKSVKKKLKDKAFAKGVSRDNIINGAEDLGEDLGEHIQLLIDAIKGIQGELEL